MSLVTIIIPTYNNREYLDPCVMSIFHQQSTPGLFDVIVVNNGDLKSIPKTFRHFPGLTVIDAGKNLGWEGGLKEGLKHTSNPYVVFMNDDTFIPLSSSGWVYEMLMNFEDKTVGAVGPGTNCAMGLQNIFIPTPNVMDMEVNFLIGFCLMVKREVLDKVGGIDDSHPNHGDDLDLSIRLREAGYKLICNKGVFVYHHGFKTGQREHGSEWNSVEMTEKTNHWLIKKHGLKTFMKYIFNPLAEGLRTTPHDSEGDICRKYAKGNVVELGCGHQKTVDNAMGIDIVPKGEFIPGLPGMRSIADLTHDIQEPIPLSNDSYDTLIARHILEHLVDPIKTLIDWGRIVRSGGRIIIAVPNQIIRSTIPMNYQHVHAYTPDSLKTLMEHLGWHTEAIEDPENTISFVGIFSKNGVSSGLQ